MGSHSQGQLLADLRHRRQDPRQAPHRHRRRSAATALGRGPTPDSRRRHPLARSDRNHLSAPDRRPKIPRHLLHPPRRRRAVGGTGAAGGPTAARLRLERRRRNRRAPNRRLRLRHRHPVVSRLPARLAIARTAWRRSQSAPPKNDEERIARPRCAQHRRPPHRRNAGKRAPRHSVRRRSVAHNALRRARRRLGRDRLARPARLGSAGEPDQPGSCDYCRRQSAQGGYKPRQWSRTRSVRFGDHEPAVHQADEPRGRARKCADPGLRGV